MIRHVFLWSVRPDAGDDAADRVLAAMERVRRSPMKTRSWSLSADRPPPGTETTGGRWEYGVMADFDDDAHFDAYHTQPEVVAASAEINELISGFAIFDFDVAEATSETPEL